MSEVKTDKISSVSTNGDITLDPDGTGAVVVDAPIKLDGNYPTGLQNVAMGDTALDDGSLSGNANTAIGHAAMTANTSGSNNVGIGKNALLANTTGNDNVAVGKNNMDANSTGSNNTALGSGALTSNTTASNNTAVGHNCLAANTTGTNNTCFGRDAGQRVTTGSQNTLIGDNAGENVTTPDNNTFIGRSAGSTVTTGADNTIIGRYNGNQGGLDIRTSSNNIVLSDGDGNPRSQLNSEALRVSDGSTMRNQIAYAHSDAAGATNKIGFHMTDGPAVVHSPSSSRAFEVWTSHGGQPGSSMAKLHFRVEQDGDVRNTNNSYGSLSDSKLKQDITAAGSQWNDIKALQVKNYRLKDQVANLGDDNAPTMLGVVAQDLEAAGMAGLVKSSPDIVDGVDQGTTTKSVKYSVLYMKAVKALQEAMTKIETLETEMTALKARVTALENA